MPQPRLSLPCVLVCSFVIFVGKDGRERESPSQKWNDLKLILIHNWWRMNDNSWLCPKEPVWLLKNGIFIKAIIETLSNDSAICTLEDGSLAQVKKPLLFQRNPAYKQFNAQRWDLMDTDVLNEPQVLKTLKFRLENNRIYTFVENSLISVNPYINLSSLYSTELKEFYGENIINYQESIRDFEPHIYSITAFMLRELKNKQTDQAVIISGESGSGKTEANKECLRFLQFFFHQEKSSLDKDIDDILSLSNPILEAFGNSKTIRNNNSSRFGKYLNISLNQRLQIRHVKIYNYLLEKSRIISRADNEQNFHVFYELLKGLTKSEKLKYFLANSNGKEYRLEDLNYLRSKNLKYEQHPEISFERVKQSLNTLRDKDAYDFACRLLSAILLLGNLIPFESENEDCCRIQNEDILVHICELLKIKKETLMSALTCYPIRIGSETLTKYFNGREVQELIHSLAKILYEKLFQWIINEINSISHYQGKEKLINLGFLDIYGFEILESNSLEQLFINYTNERLHQIYLSKIFKQEEDLFKRQGLFHKFINIPFSDNVGVLELIDLEPLSIFNQLDEWCAVASPDDSSFITKLRHKHKKHPNFPPANFNLPSNIFLIRHSPKDIQYSVIGFRQKNKDLVREEIKMAMRSSGLKSLSNLFDQNIENQQTVAKSNHKMRKFLSLKFRHEMTTLMVDLLGKCDLHFIRCVKSNSFKHPLLMEDEVVYNQICYLGILDTIKLKKIGYCMKLDYMTIDKRFQWLVRHYFTQPAFPKEVTTALKSFLARFDEEQILFGKTMVFFKDYVYTALVKKYDEYVQNLNEKSYMIQRNWHIYKLHRQIIKMRKSTKTIVKYLKSLLTNDAYKETLKGIVKVQSAVRQKLSRLRGERRLKNIIVLQSYIKKQIYRSKRMNVTKSVEMIASLFRRNILRKRVQKLAIINKMKKYIIERCWMKVVMSRKYKIQAYLLGFLTQIGSKSQIIVANQNTKTKFREKYLKTIKNYIKTFSTTVNHQKLIKKIIFTQKLLKTWIYRQKFLKLKQAAIIIQRAYRQYYFNKNTAKQIFDINFGEYKLELQNQNNSIRKFLYENSMMDSLKILYSNYLNKFKSKCSLLYMIIDFETFINLEHAYPENSWLLNYFQIVKESFEKDNPIQEVKVAETFSIAATTNKLYVWGLNKEFKTLEKAVIIKPQGQTRIEKMEIKRENVEIHYQGSKKQETKEYSTVNKRYSLQNGKMYELKDNTVRPIKMPSASDRIVEIACGSNHVIMRSNNKKVLTFGNGKHGQLGHGNYFSIDQPKIIEFQQFKNYSAIQVSASFNSSIVLLNNRKIYWFGSNGTIDKVKSPVLFDILRKSEQFGNGEFAPIRILSSWSRSMSVIGISFIHFNGKLSGNIGLRNKIFELIVTKWQEQDINRINPPFNPAYSDYLEQCHVKLPKTKVSIEPESKKILRKLEQKANSYQTDKYNDFSFSDQNFK